MSDRSTQLQVVSSLSDAFTALDSHMNVLAEVESDYGLLELVSEVAAIKNRLLELTQEVLDA